MAKLIIVIEGPAGSGKTTLARSLLSEKVIDGFVHSSLMELTGSRLPTNVADTALQSLVNDHRKLAEAIVHPGHLVGVDRCFLSQMVYHQIREGVPPNRTTATDIAMMFRKSMDDAVHFINQEMGYRLGVPINLTPEWALYIDLELTQEDLALRRHMGGKAYPAGFRDYQWYQLIGQIAERRGGFHLVNSEDDLIDALFDRLEE